MKLGILSTTALLLALSCVNTLNAQEKAERLDPTPQTPRVQPENLPQPQQQPPLEKSEKEASLAAAIELNKKAIAALPRLLGTRPEPITPTEELLEPSLGSPLSAELPPLAAASFYLPEVPPTMNGYIWPAEGTFTSGYGWRWGRMHYGIDIAGPVGTPILAAAEGIVITAEWHMGGYGNLVEIEHLDGSITLYAHNHRILVSEGDRVQAGQAIAQMGSTGFSTGPHLHFEVHLPEQGAVNPLAFLPESGLAARLP